MPSARMFHPHNGRDGFEHATSHVKLENIRLTMTPALQQAIKERYKEIGDAAFAEFGL